MPLKPSDNKPIYEFCLSHLVADADIVETAESSKDGLGSGYLAGVSVERSAETGEDDIGGGDT